MEEQKRNGACGTYLLFVAAVVYNTVTTTPLELLTTLNEQSHNSTITLTTDSKSMSPRLVMLAEWILRMSSRDVSLGSGISIFRSKRPGRRSAGSRISVMGLHPPTSGGYAAGRDRGQEVDIFMSTCYT